MKTVYMTVEIKMRVNTDEEVSTEEALRLLKKLEHHIYKTVPEPEFVEFDKITNIQDVT